MNIDDNKLNDLMNKTDRNIQKHSRKRKMIAAGSLSAFSLVLAVAVFSLLYGSGELPDITMESSTAINAASENSATATPMPDGSTQDPTMPTPEPDLSKPWENWDMAVTTNGVEMSINVDMSYMERYPSDKVFSAYESLPSDFNIETAKKAVDYFLGENYYEYGITKDDYAIKLAAAKAAYERMDLSSSEKKQALNYISYLESSQQDAPDTLKPGTIEFSDDNGDKRLVLRAFSDNASPSLEVTNYGEKYGDPLSRTLAYDRGDPDRNYLETTMIYNEALSSDEVEKLEAANLLANQAVAQFSDEMQLNISVQGYVYDASLELDNSENHIDTNTAEKCYVFYYSRNYDGLIADLDLSPLPYSEGEAVTAIAPNNIPSRWRDEYIKVVVDDLGIAKFAWLNKTAAGAAESAANITSSEAEQIFKQKFKEKDFDLTSGSKVEIEVNRLQLHMVRTENSGKFKMIPAYVVKGTMKAVTSNGKEILYGNAADNKSLLVISALDGSIID